MTFWCYACVTASLAIVDGSTARQSPLDSPQVRLQLPSTIAPCDIVRIANRVALESGLPIGIESAPQPTTEQCTNDVPQRLLTGPPVSARAALDHLVGLAPDYAWREMGRVIVLRPVPAWNDASHFLESPVGPFSATDTDMKQALAAISQPLGRRVFNPGFGRLTSGGTQPHSFAVTFGGGSLLNALNALVGLRGNWGWTVSYCGGRAALDTATVALWIYEADQRRVRAALSSDPRRPGSPCR